jgi:hypothetical protein
VEWDGGEGLYSMFPVFHPSVVSVKCTLLVQVNTCCPTVVVCLEKLRIYYEGIVVLCVL